MLRPLQQWYCDFCDGVIDRPEQGYVIWKFDENHRTFGFKVIHQTRCDNQDYPSSIDVKSLLGKDGLTYLLSFLSVGPIKNRLGDKGFCSVLDIDGFVDLMRRMQVPHYEDARRHFADDDVLVHFADSNEVAPYQVEALHGLALGGPSTL